MATIYEIRVSRKEDKAFRAALCRRRPTRRSARRLNRIRKRFDDLGEFGSYETWRSAQAIAQVLWQGTANR